MAVLLFLCHFIFLMHYYEPAISTLDSHGYYGQAKQFATTGSGVLHMDSRLQYAGPAWKKAGENRRVSMWPPGLPLILAAVYRVAGPDAMFLVNPLLASFSLALLFLICRAWFGAGWGVAAAALLGCTPFFNEHALFGYSHIAVLFFLVLGLYFLTQWVRTGSWPPALCAGLCAGCLPCIRYPATLFSIAFGAYLLLQFRRHARPLPALAAFAAGAALPVAALAFYNLRLFGALWTTGYSLIGYSPATLFKWDAFRASAPVYIQQLTATGAGPAFALGAAGAACLCARRDHWKQGVLLALLIFPITILYMAYPQYPHPQSMRFLIPTFPVYAMAGAWFLSMFTKDRPGTAAAFALVLIAFTAAWGLPLSLGKMQAMQQRQEVLADITRQVKKHAPRGSVIIADDLVCQNLDVYGTWRIVSTASLSSNRIPLYGDLIGAPLFRAFLDDVQVWAGTADVYWLGNEKRLHTLADAMRSRGSLKPLATISIPILDNDHEPRLRRGTMKTSRRPGKRNRKNRTTESSRRRRAPFVQRDPLQGIDQRWEQDYNLVPESGDTMDHAFESIVRQSPVRLYKLRWKPGRNPHIKGADQ